MSQFCWKDLQETHGLGVKTGEQHPGFPFPKTWDEVNSFPMTGSAWKENRGANMQLLHMILDVHLVLANLPQLDD